MPDLQQVTPTNGPRAGGNTITLSSSAGTALHQNDVIRVTVDGVDATGVTMPSTTRIVVVAPAYASPTGPATAVLVVVKSTALGTSTNNVQYTYNIRTCALPRLSLIQVGWGGGGEGKTDISTQR